VSGCRHQGNCALAAEAIAGFLEFTGQGLSTFERAMDLDERPMAVLGSRILSEEEKVGEAAEAIELRQTGENSILSIIAGSVSESLSQVLRWAGGAYALTFTSTLLTLRGWTTKDVFALR
jgi:hypothetical protein